MVSSATAERATKVRANGAGSVSPPKPPAKEPQVEPDVVAAAEAEVKDDTKTIEWRGVSLTVPSEIPPVLMFDFVSMETEDNAMSLMRMFHTLLGPDQFVEVRNVISKVGPEEQADVIGELSEVVMGAYGTDTGKSEG